MTSLPRPRTPLIGREREIAGVCALLGEESVPLVTLTGPGGVGKTRLAVAVARALAPAFPDGVRFVDLAPVRDPDLVGTAIAQALGVRETGDRPLIERLQTVLAGKPLLLVLDNLEHVLAAAPLIGALLAIGPGPRCLATSRERLRLSGEHAFPVGPLPLPPIDASAPLQLAANEAIRLFVERARAIRPDFALNEANAPTIAAICRRLDGLPLAIELAAARVELFPPAALLARLERALPLLTGGARDLPTRLQTMRDAIAWSHDLLTVEEQTLFRRLAVFVGGFTLEAAAVCGAEALALEPWHDVRDDVPEPWPAPPDPRPAILEGIASLVGKSLLRRQEGADGGPEHPGGAPDLPGASRFAMLETVREFGLAQLEASGEAEALRRRHAVYCVRWTEQFAIGLRGPEERAFAARFDADYGNIRAALAWAIAGREAELALRLAAALNFYWVHHGLFREGRDWAEQALALTGNVPTGIRLAAMIAAGLDNQLYGDYDRQRRVAEEMLEIARREGGKRYEAQALYLLSFTARNRGDHAAAVALAEQALALFRQVGSRGLLALSLLRLGNELDGLGELDRAEAVVTEALRLWSELGFAAGQAQALTILAGVARSQGDVPRAVELYRERLTLFAHVGHRWDIVGTLFGLAEIALVTGEAERAARLAGAAGALSETMGFAPYGHGRDVAATLAVGLREALEEEAAARERETGRRMPLAQAIAEALTVAPPAPPVPTPGSADVGLAYGLTPRELDVLRLVAEGRTDREIAEALFVSPRTVGKHVAAILAKCGVPSRAAAATHAVRHGLV
jgi:predicted ATPase/DNA-binding CsgD family transcriptional regulator